MNGISREKGLVSSWSPEGENLLWRNTEISTRSTPIVMNGKVYLLSRSFPDSNREGEKVSVSTRRPGRCCGRTPTTSS
jgi:hypothetical protein